MSNRIGSIAVTGRDASGTGKRIFFSSFILFLVYFFFVYYYYVYHARNKLENGFLYRTTHLHQLASIVTCSALHLLWMCGLTCARAPVCRMQGQHACTVQIWYERSKGIEGTSRAAAVAHPGNFEKFVWVKSNYIIIKKEKRSNYIG